MFGLGMGELVLIFIIALIFIGPKKLPELAKGLGQGLKEFQKAAKGLTDNLQDAVNENDKTSSIEPAKVADVTQRDDFQHTETHAPSDVAVDATNRDEFQHTESIPKKEDDKQS